MRGMAAATTQTRAESVIRARKICVLMLIPLIFGFRMPGLDAARKSANSRTLISCNSRPRRWRAALGSADFGCLRKICDFNVLADTGRRGPGFTAAHGHWDNGSAIML